MKGCKECAPLGGAVAPCGLKVKDRPRETEKSLPFNPAAASKRQLMNNRIGSSTCDKCTYVYPAKLKEMIRTAFPKDICNYPDPCHENVVKISMDDLKRMEFT